MIVSYASYLISEHPQSAWYYKTGKAPGDPFEHLCSLEQDILFPYSMHLPPYLRFLPVTAQGTELFDPT